MCSHAFPIQPVGFWPLPKEELPDGADIAQADVEAAQQRFLESYFKGEEGHWFHGDFIRITESRAGNGGGFIMLGRSDGVLNPGGIRFGPTDIYSVLENPAFAARGLEECLVVGLLVEDGSDEKVILFVKMREGTELDDELLKLIKTSIRTARSARHVPSRIIQVTDVPMTLTGKKIEGTCIPVSTSAVKALTHSQCPSARSSTAPPCRPSTPRLSATPIVSSSMSPSARLCAARRVSLFRHWRDLTVDLVLVPLDNVNIKKHNVMPQRTHKTVVREDQP